MTEAAWITCTRPETMLEFLRGKSTERKLRLSAIACCRRIWHLLTDERCRSAVEVAEKYCDGTATGDELEAARDRAHHAFHPPPEDFGDEAIMWAAAFVADAPTPFIVEQVVSYTSAVAAADGLDDTSTIRLLHDIFGNPFHPLPPRPEAIAPLAEEIYAGAWSKMPLLGQWLEEHGYATEAEHCFDPNVHHVKGCWVVDWVTGRD